MSSQDAATYYTVLHPEEFKTDWAAFYRQADAATLQTRAQVRHQLDYSYGADVKQRLDLYFPQHAPTAAPVFLFLHGGGFREGDRAQYGFVARPFATRGIITAVASYRLTDDGFRHPHQRDDAQLALLWLYQNIASYGGDPERMYIGGHSCGAIMAADIGVNRTRLERAGMAKQALRGLVAVSALYDLRTPSNPNEEKVFWGRYAPTAETREKASPILNIVDPVPEAIFAAGSTENAGLDDYVKSSKAFAAKLSSFGTQARYLSLQGAGHKDTVVALGADDSELFQSAFDMMSAPHAPAAT